MALLDLLHPLDCALHELVVDRLLDERAARAGADLALVEREHRKAFERLVEELVVGLHHVGEEDIGRFAAEFERDRDQVLRRVLHDKPAGGRLAGEGDLRDALALGERLASLDAEPVDDVEDAGGQQIADQFHQRQNAERRLFGRLEDDAIACSDCGAEFPNRHQQREVPGNDLADDAERLMIVVRDHVVVDLAERAFLGAQRAGEVAPMVDAERQVGMGRLADRLAIVERLDKGEKIEILLHAVGDLEQNVGAVGDRRPGPGVLGGMGGVERELDVSRRRARDRAQPLTGDRARVVEIAPLDRGDPLAADEVAVFVADEAARRNLVNRRLIHGVPPVNGADGGGAEGEDCPSMHFKHSGYALRSTVNCRSSCDTSSRLRPQRYGPSCFILQCRGARNRLRSLAVFETSLPVCARGRCNTARSASLMSSAAAGRGPWVRDGPR